MLLVAAEDSRNPCDSGPLMVSTATAERRPARIGMVVNEIAKLVKRLHARASSRV
jgi:hypothetical protein